MIIYARNSNIRCEDYETVKETKKHLILDALERNGGNYTEAARMLGVHPNNLHRLARNLGLKTNP